MCVCMCARFRRYLGVRISQVCRLEDEEVTRMPPLRGGGEIGQMMTRRFGDRDTDRCALTFKLRVSRWLSD